MTLTSVLFAGGESRRMGADKATIEIAGEPLWKRQLHLLRELSPEKILISARNRPAWGPSEIEIILDEPTSRGPLSGMVAALKHLRTTHLLALAVDLPQMTTGHLRKLWSQAQPGVGIVPQNAKYFEPLCAVYPIEALATAKNLLASDDVSLQSFAQKLLEQNRARIYPVNEAARRFYHNVNTPADLPPDLQDDSIRAISPRRTVPPCSTDA
jgi:molybdenum cofactor guanylyltransferase